MQHWREARNEAVFSPLAVGAGAILLVGLLSAIVAGRVTRPIAQLRSQVERISQGDFTPLPLAPRNDEIRDLGASINRMAEMLARYEEQVRRMLQDPRSRSGLREKNGSLLDQSTIVYGCGIADSDRHTHTGLPLVLVGGGGTFRGGRRIDLGKDTPLANLTSRWRNARECNAALSVTAPESWISKCISLS